MDNSRVIVKTATMIKKTAIIAYFTSANQKLFHKLFQNRQISNVGSVPEIAKLQYTAHERVAICKTAM